MNYTISDEHMNDYGFQDEQSATEKSSLQTMKNIEIGRKGKV